MSEQNPAGSAPESPPLAQVQTRRHVSIIWVVPLIAVLIGGWLAFKALSEKGPTITIAFETAEGLEAGKTRIKFKDVEIGTVTGIELSEDLSGVIVSAQMHKEADAYLTENSRFWVVRARVAAGEVSGLGTLFSGAYIGCSPSREGKRQLHFNGLETPPVMTEGLPGRHFVLDTETLGSLDLGSPVYYRGVKVGEVVGYEFAADAERLLVKIFITAPYHEKVRKNTRFWNASGINLTMDATGVRLATQSLVSIMLGGVAFDLRQHDKPGDAAEEAWRFLLHPDQESSQLDAYVAKRYYLMYFDQNVRGLAPGAPVEIRGFQVGEVVNVELHFDMDRLDFRIPVLVVVDPGRMGARIREESPVKDDVDTASSGEDLEAEQFPRRLQPLLDKGLRAQLKTGNLLTGQLYVDIDFFPQAPPATMQREGGYTVFPTIPAATAQMAQRVDNILLSLEQVPFAEIGGELRVAIAELTSVLAEINGLSGSVSRETLPKVNAAIDDLQRALQSAELTLGQDSALQYNARLVLNEMSLAIRALRSLLESLERDPQALLLGKQGEKK